MKTFDKWTATLTLAAVSALALSQSGPPQGGPGQGRGPGGPGGPGFPGGPGQGPDRGQGFGRGPMGPGMRGGMMMGGGPQILRRPDVQKELKLTQEQIEKLNAILGGPAGGFPRGPGGPGGPPPGGEPNGGFPGGGFQGGPLQGGPPQGGPRQGGFRQGPGNPPQDGPAGLQRGRGGSEFVKQLEKQIKEVLSAAQFNRYRELVLQNEGPSAMARPDVADQVGLSNEKREKILEIVQSAGPGMRGGPPQGGFQRGGPPHGGFPQGGPPQGGFQGGPPQGGFERGPGQPGDFEAMRQQMEKQRKEVGEKILALLSADEKAKWKSLLGREFKFETLGPPREDR